MNDPITIQHLDEASEDWIQDQAARRGVDKETVVLHLIHEGISLEQKRQRLPVHHDLDFMFGTWSKEEAEEFERVTEPLRQIDEELWR